MTSDNKMDSIDVEPSYVLLLSYLKDTSRDIWVLIYVKGDEDVYKRQVNIGAYIYYSFTTFGCIFMLVNTSLCKVSSKRCV